jgi:hypothetical protein
MKLRSRAMGFAIGTSWGLAVLFLTILASALQKGHTLSVLAAYYYGYSISISGAFVGLIWGFVSGFVFWALAAWLYNAFAKVIYKGEAGTSKS